MAPLRADVVIAGAGIAGVAAAIEAAARGLDVTVIDPDSEPGGTARFSGGGICVAGSALQEAAGIGDTPAVALDDWLAMGGPSADAAWAQRYLEASAAEVFGFLTGTGVQWLGARSQEGNRLPRWHAPAGAGAGIMDPLLRRARREPRISWQLGSRVTGLTRTGGAVTGVTARGPHGDAEYQARSVLLATGGFCSDADLVARHSPHAAAGQRVLLAGGPGATGDGHRLAGTVSAALANTGTIWMYAYATPDYQQGARGRGLVLRGNEADVWVNSAGRRFHNEALRGGASATPALLAQPGAVCWSLIDAPIAAQLQVWDASKRPVPGLLGDSPAVASAGDWNTLAARIGVDGRQLVQTMTGHNQARRLHREADPEFGRPLAGLEPLDQPPFYAIRFHAAARKNLGGVRTDASCQVLTAGGAVVPGLFAAGELAGMAGGHINGQAALEGTMLGPSLFSGRVAGRAV